LNFGTPLELLLSSEEAAGEAKRSEKVVDMKGCVEKVKLLNEFKEFWLLLLFSKLVVDEDAIRKRREKGGEVFFVFGFGKFRCWEMERVNIKREKNGLCSCMYVMFKVVFLLGGVIS